MHEIYAKLRNIKVFKYYFYQPEIPREDLENSYLNENSGGNGIGYWFYNGDGEGNGARFNYGNGGNGTGGQYGNDFNLIKPTMDFANA